jgi:hypothetical protein
MVSNNAEPPAVVLTSPDQHLSTFNTQSKSPSPTQETVGSADLQPFSRIFTASSGQRVLFRQVFGQWQAELQSASNVYTPQRILPVVSSCDIGTLLTLLQGQDDWSSRSHIHIMATTHPPYAPCVYLGKNGLLGGGENRQRAPLKANEEWISGPRMILRSEATRCEIFHIPRNYRYKDFRVEFEVVERASYTIRYVEANSEEVINTLEHEKDSHGSKLNFAADVANNVRLAFVNAGAQVERDENHQVQYTSGFSHAALVLYGSTNKNRTGSKRSELEVQVIILVEKIPEISPHNSKWQWTFIIPTFIALAASCLVLFSAVKSN